MINKNNSTALIHLSLTVPPVQSTLQQ